MKVYVDLLLFLNFAFDLLLLETTSIILKRRTSFRRLVLGALVGSLTMFALFIPFTTFTLFMLKILLSIIISIITFGFKDIKYTLNNLFYFYITSILLGGFLYYLNVEFSYKNMGMIFYHKGLSINYIFILIASPIILIIYRKQMKKLKEMNSLHYQVDVYFTNDKIIKLHSFLDTGNTLVDPITKKKVIITNNKEANKLLEEMPYYLVPYESVNTNGLLKCLKVEKIYIEGLGLYKNVVLAVTKEKLKSGVDTILNYLIIKDKTK